MSLHPVLERVTTRIRERSAASRAAYLARIDAARPNGPARARLSCGPRNWVGSPATSTSPASRA